MTIFELSSVTSRGRKDHLNTALHLKFHLQKRGKSELRHRSSAGCEHVQTLEDEKRTKMLGESDRQRKLHDTCSTTLGGKDSEKDFQGSLKRQAKALKGV